MFFFSAFFMKKVSVIIPCHNSEKYITQCLESVLNQTFRKTEIICVDDGSTDGTRELLEIFKAKDKRIKLIFNKKSNAGAARNAGLKACEGKYLWFMDSDDFSEPGFLEKAVESLDESGSDMLVTHADVFNENTQVFEKGWGIVDEWLPLERPVNHSLFKGNAFLTIVGWPWDKVFRTDFIKKMNLKFQELDSSNDLKFVFSAIILASKIDILDDILVHHRINRADSIENSKGKDFNCFYEALTALKRKLSAFDAFYDVADDFIRYALNFSFWHYDHTPEEKKAAFLEKLKGEWWKKFGCLDKPRDFFTFTGDWDRMQDLLS